MDECFQSLKIVSQCLERLEQLEGEPTMVDDPAIAWPARMSLAADGQGQSLEHVREIMGTSTGVPDPPLKLVTQGFHVPAGRFTRRLSTLRVCWVCT